MQGHSFCQKPGVGCSFFLPSSFLPSSLGKQSQLLLQPTDFSWVCKLEWSLTTSITTTTTSTTTNTATKQTQKQQKQNNNNNISANTRFLGAIRKIKSNHNNNNNQSKNNSSNIKEQHKQQQSQQPQQQTILMGCDPIEIILVLFVLSKYSIFLPSFKNPMTLLEY